MSEDTKLERLIVDISPELYYAICENLGCKQSDTKRTVTAAYKTWLYEQHGVPEPLTASQKRDLERLEKQMAALKAKMASLKHDTRTLEDH